MINTRVALCRAHTYTRLLMLQEPLPLNKCRIVKRNMMVITANVAHSPALTVTQCDLNSAVRYSNVCPHIRVLNTLMRESYA